MRAGAVTGLIIEDGWKVMLQIMMLSAMKYVKTQMAVVHFRSSTALSMSLVILIPTDHIHLGMIGLIQNAIYYQTVSVWIFTGPVIFLYQEYNLNPFTYCP